MCVYLLLNKKIMNKFIISESEKQRILEMHQNATSRQYLSENTTKDVVYTTITLYYDLLPNKVKKRVTYMSFSTNVSTYKTEDIQTIKSFDLGGTVLSPTAQKMSPEKVITGTLPYNKSLESLIGKGASTSTANTLIPTIKTQEGKVTTSMTPLSTIVTVIEQQRQTPTQKESDLTRIVKRVINERNFLMEESDGPIQTMTVKVPITKGKDNVERFATNYNVEVIVDDMKGEGTNTRLEEFKSISNLQLGETQINTGRALTNFKYIFLASDRKLQNYLLRNIGKTFDPWDNEAGVVLNKKTGGLQFFKCQVTFVKNIIPAQN